MHTHHSQVENEEEVGEESRDTPLGDWEKVIVGWGDTADRMEAPHNRDAHTVVVSFGACAERQKGALESLNR